MAVSATRKRLSRAVSQKVGVCILGVRDRAGPLYSYP